MYFGFMKLLTTGMNLWDLIVLLVWAFLPLLLCFFAAYRMAQHAGLPRPWLAFLPLVGHFYIMGKLAEPSGFHRTGRNRWPSLWYPLWTTVFFLSYAFLEVKSRGYHYIDSLQVVCMGCLLVSWVATMVLNAYVLYSVLWDRLRQRAGLYTFLSMILPLEGIFLLLVMDLVPRSVTGHKQYLDGQPRYDKNHQWSPPPPKKSAKPKKNR